MDDFEALLLHLEAHLLAPQKSERWAMYRLIAPIVDFANTRTAHTAYFEFNQTSEHGTSQSVDIALLNANNRPVVIVEAKRVDRRIGPDQIAKYMAILDNNVPGIVTNGVNWILCINDRSKVLSIWNPGSATVNIEALQEIISVLQGQIATDLGWSTSTQYLEPALKPRKLPKVAKATRVSNLPNPAHVLQECLAQLATLNKATAAEIAFLENLIHAVGEAHGDVPESCRLEFRSSRVAFFDERLTTRSKRVGRIELGKTHPDILVLTDIVSRSPALTAIAPAEPADKGPHMRRFRLPDSAAAAAFGQALGSVLFVNPTSPM